MEISWKEFVKEAMGNLGGKATLSQLYEEVARVDKKKGYGRLATNHHYEAKVRQTVQLSGLFYQKEKGSGVWFLKKQSKTKEVV